MSYKIVKYNNVNYLAQMIDNRHHIVTTIPTKPIHLEETIDRDVPVKIGNSNCILSRIIINPFSEEHPYEVIEIDKDILPSFVRSGAFLGGVIGIVFGGPMGGIVGSLMGEVIDPAFRDY
jgi:hypothetical protein